MRTTLNIDADAFGILKKYADEHALSLSRAASDLIHRGSENRSRFNTNNGWVVLDAAPGANAITSEQVKLCEMLDHDEEYRRSLSPRSSL